MHKKLLLRELLFDLANLHGAHAAAIGSQFAGGVLLEGDQEFFRSRGGEGSEELFFEDGEGSLEGFQIVGCGFLLGGRTANLGG